MASCEFAVPCVSINSRKGRLAQWWRRCLTSTRSLVRTQYRPPYTSCANRFLLVRTFAMERLRNIYQGSFCSSPRSTSPVGSVGRPVDRGGRAGPMAFVDRPEPARPSPRPSENYIATGRTCECELAPAERGTLQKAPRMRRRQESAREDAPPTSSTSVSKPSRPVARVRL